MALTIGFDATAAARQRAGIGRYTRELLSALNALDDATRYRLFYCAGGETAGSLPPLSRRFAVRAIPLSDRWVNALWQRARLPIPAQAVAGAFDVFHSPDFTLPPVWRRPTVLTVHDLAFLVRPECAYPTLRAYLERVVPRSAERATRIIAVSQQTRRDLIERLGLPPERITVVPEAAGERFTPDRSGEPALEVQRRYGLAGPYLLSVGTLEPRKNYVRLLHAYAELRRRGVEQQLVVAGAPGWLYDPIFAALNELNLGPFVTFLQPDEPGLRVLYQAASGCIFPTLYEGFGIPALEALACGAPVACSSASSLPEVVGDAALLFDPEDIDAIIDSVQRLLGDEALSKKLQERGPRQAARFSWHAAAQETMRIYHEVASGG